MHFNLLGSRANNLTTTSNRLEHRKDEFLTAQRIAEHTLATGGGREGALLTPERPIVKIEPTTLSIFNGCKRDYHRWKKDRESLLWQGKPTG